MGRASREKGKRGERELAKELERLFGVECRRGQQYSGLGGEDVVGLPGIHLEAKRVESFRLWPSLAQAVEDAGEQVPVVCTRANGRPWVAVVRLDDLPRLVELLYLVLASEQ